MPSFSYIRRVCHQGNSQRRGNSVINSIFGFLVFLFVFFLLVVWEQNSKAQVDGVVEIGGDVVEVSAELVDSANRDKIVLVAGRVAADRSLRDEVLPYEFEAVKIRRSVEMYQWEETVSRPERVLPGGGSVKQETYTYETVWSYDLIESSQFWKKEHANPRSFPYSQGRRLAREVVIGKFRLSEDHVKALPETRIPVTVISESLGKRHPDGISLVNGAIYIGANPEKPRIGDAKITFYGARSGNYTVIGRQTGDTISPVVASNGVSLTPAGAGKLSAGQLIEMEARKGSVPWIARIVFGIFFLLLFYVILEPFAVVLDKLPHFGSSQRLANLYNSIFLSIIASVAAFVIGRYYYDPFMETSAMLASRLFEWILSLFGVRALP